jgi:hypothetical protein
MSMISITRRDSATGKLQTPHLYKAGYYKVADPAFGEDKKKKEFEIKVRTLVEVLAFAQRGFHVRMSAGRGEAGPSLITPDNLTIHVAGERP